MVKKLVKILLFLLLIVVVGGFAGVVADRFVMPWLSSKDSLKKFKFFQKANERVTVINNTEQVMVKEDFSVVKTAQNVLPSVVSIVTYDSATTGQAGIQNIKTSQDIQNYVKTGVILTSDGLIASVQVQDDQNQIPKENLRYKVLAVDGREFDAQVKAIDAYNDLVYYKIDGGNFSSPALGNSDELEDGEKIIVGGNAGGEYQTTFSLGIIRERDKTFSLLNSELSSSEKMEGAIITDAQIDNKNIGGPVIDFSGSIVGIADQITKDNKKVSFVMPINLVKESLDRLIQAGKIERPALGLYYLSINREIALLNDLGVNQGALVYSFSGQQGLAVLKNSPADKAGVMIGDIITGVDFDEISLSNSLSAIIARHQKGDEVTLKLIRQEKNIEIKLKLE